MQEDHVRVHYPANWLQADLRTVEAARAVLNAESVTPGDAARIFAAADADSNGRIDLAELARAIARLQPPAAPLAAARDAAVDAFVVFAVNPTR